MEDLAELAELLSEPPGGRNHGRLLSDGQWRPLDGSWDEDQADWIPNEKGVEVSFKTYARRSSSTERHGTLYAYVKLKCRCGLCRKAKAAYERQRRSV